MAREETPGQLVVKARDRIRDDYLRDYQLRNPGADVGATSQPFVDASAVADQVLPIYANAQVAARAGVPAFCTGQALLDYYSPLIGGKLPAVGAQGYLTVSASAGGGQLQTGDLFAFAKTQVKYAYAGPSGVFADGSPVLVVASVATGPSTNLAANAVLSVVSPRAGMGATARVQAQADGTGLSGGHDAEADDDYRQRGNDYEAKPPSAGNDGDYHAAILRCPGLSVQSGFTYPAIVGPGTMGVAFLMQPTRPGSSRLPNGAQTSLMLAYLKALFNGDDGVMVAAGAAQPVTVALKVRWRRGAASWSDAAPWPAYNAVSKVHVDGGAAISATAFRVTSTQAQPADPQVGQTVAVVDLKLGADGAPVGKFKRKRVLTVAVVVATKSWDLTFDTTNAASDAGYAPVANQAVSPWSDALDDLVPPLLDYFDHVGPGEMVANFVDPGVRQRRLPESPTEWPSEVTNSILIGPPSRSATQGLPAKTPILKLPSVGDAVLLEPTVPFETAVGAPGVSYYVLTLGDVAAYPET